MAARRSSASRGIPPPPLRPQAAARLPCTCSALGRAGREVKQLTPLRTRPNPCRLQEVQSLSQQLGSKEAELEQVQKALRSAQQGWSTQKSMAWLAAHNQLLEDAKDDLYHDSLVLRARLREAGTAHPLEAGWTGGGGHGSGGKAERRGHERGVVVPAGSPRSLANAFVTLHLLRHHLNCSLPAAVM